MTATTTPTTTTRPRPRAGSIALWVLQVLVVLLYLGAAYTKIAADPVAVAGFARMGFGDVGRTAIGVVEVLGAIGLLIPRLAGLAATCFIGLMVPATIFTLIFDPTMWASPVVVLVAVTVIAWFRRDETRGLVRQVTGR